MTDNRTDQELIAAANRGDAAAMEALYYRHRDWAFALARRYCKRPADAEDVLQEVFKYFFSKFPGFALTCQLRTFLFPAVRNRCLDLLNKQRRQVELSDGAAARQADCSADAARSRREIADIVAQLPAEQRDVVMLRFMDGCKIDEIAARLNIPPGTVKSRLHNGLRRLREST